MKRGAAKYSLSATTMLVTSQEGHTKHVLQQLFLVVAKGKPTWFSFSVTNGGGVQLSGHV